MKNEILMLDEIEIIISLIILKHEKRERGLTKFWLYWKTVS